MLNYLTKPALYFAFMLLLVMPFCVLAQSAEPERFNNENWFTLPHPTVETFTVLETGDAYGTTTTSVPFTFTDVPNDYGVRIMRFEIQDHYHFVVDGIVVYSLSELSIGLANLSNP